MCGNLWYVKNKHKVRKKKEKKNTSKIRAPSPIKDLVAICTSLCKRGGEQMLAFTHTEVGRESCFW